MVNYARKNHGDFFSPIARPRKTSLGSKNAPGCVLSGLFNTDSMIPHMEKRIKLSSSEMKNKVKTPCKLYLRSSLGYI